METKGSRGNPSTTVNRHRQDSLRTSTLSSFLSRASIRVAAVSLLAALAWACSTGKAAPPPAPATVAVVDVVKQDVPLRTEWVTTLDGYVNARIRPQVSGYLVKQNYLEGSYVKKDDALFEIDPRPFQATYDQARAQLAQAVAQLGRATRDVERDIPLAQARAIPRSQLDTDTQVKLAAAASVDSAKAAVKTAQLNLGFTKVRSLTDGIAGIALGQLGDLVGPSTLLTSVSRLDPIKAYVAISEREYLQFVGGVGGEVAARPFPNADTPLELILAGGAVYPHPGKFVFGDREVDPATGTIRVAAAFPNPGNILRPGQFGRVRATLAVKEGALVVPQRAVTELQGSYQVAVVGNDNKVAIRAVKVGARVGSLWVIENGVAAGDKVVAEGIQKVRDGLSVNPVPFQPTAPAKG
jgi:membrane fusion protein (multidrug efflux system)